MKDTKEYHLKYFKDKGDFIPANSLKGVPAFDEETIQLIKTYGHWFNGLMNGELLPYTEKQRLFINAIAEENPISIEEQAWHKYLKRKELKETYREAMRRQPSLEDDSWYSREGKKEIRSTMFKVTRDEHKR